MFRKAMMFAALIACPVLPGIGAAQAEETAAQPATATADAAKDKADPVVCRSDKRTGSRLSVNRVCLKKSEWAEMQENIRSSIDDMGRGGKGPSTIGSLTPN